MAGYEEVPAIVSGSDVPQSTFGAVVTDDFFRVMGAGAVVGRTFSPEEQAMGGPSAAVIGYGLWQRAFGGSRAVLGRSIRVFGMAPVVVGIMPPGFSYPEKAELWMPKTAFGDPGLGVRTGHNWRVVGRLKPGLQMEQAQADIGAIERGIKQRYPSPFQGKDAAVVSLASHVAGEVRRPLLMLFGAVGFLLLIVCVNVANLLLVRVTARGRELAVRTALGRGTAPPDSADADGEPAAGRRRAESAALLLAAWSMDLLRVLLPADMPRADEISIDAGVIGFALAVSAAAGLVFGLLPAWRASAVNVNDALEGRVADRERRQAFSAHAGRPGDFRSLPIAGAGGGRGTTGAQLLESARRSIAGFRPDHALAADTDFERHGNESLIPKYRELLERVRAIPGVEAAAITRSLPVESGAPDGHFFIEDRRAETGNADANYSVISPGYLQNIAHPSGARARFHGPGYGEQPAGGDHQLGNGARCISRTAIHWASASGSILSARTAALADDRGRRGRYSRGRRYPRGVSAGLYVLHPANVGPDSWTAARWWCGPRCNRHRWPARCVRSIRAVNPEAVPRTRTMDSVMAASLSKQRFQMEILGGFAALALLLAAIGLYGVLSHMVTANRRRSASAWPWERPAAWFSGWSRAAH